MARFWIIIAFGALAVIVYDTLGSIASLLFDFSYAWFMPGSLAIYVTVGFLASKGDRVSLWKGLFAGSMIGLIDVTIGWYISWQIGPGALQDTELTLSLFMETATFAIGVATCAGLVGASIAQTIDDRG